MSKNLKNQVKSGFGWDLTGTFFKQLGTLVVATILARLLTPEEFGIIGMGMVFVSLSQVFVDVGFTQGLIQSQENSQTTYSSVFYLNIILGSAVALIIFLLAPLIGDFYENEEVEGVGEQITSVVKWLCFIPLIASFGSVHNARLVKNLDFKVLAFRTIISTLAGGVVGVIMAFLDYGVYALVGQQLTTALLFALILWWKSDWRPTWVFSFKEIKDLLNFSVYVFLDNLLRRFFLQLDTLFIGKYFSAATLGFYTKAASLNSQITDYTTSSLRKVLFPAFSKLQDNKKLFDASYFKVFDISIFLGTFASGVLFFLSEEIIITLFGQKWQPSVLIFQVLVFRIIFSPFGGLIGKSMLAKGLSKQNFKIGQIRRAVLLLPIYVGYLEGIYAFTVAMVAANFIAFLISLWSSHKYLKISFMEQFLAFLKPIIPLIIMVFAYYYFQVDVNAFLLALVFLCVQSAYFYITKNSGLLLTVDLLKTMLKR